MIIRQVVQPRPDVLAGHFQGDLRAYRIGRETDADKLENDPDLFFSVTYPSASLKRFVQLVHRKLSGDRHQGAFLPIGRMGSGKTHALIVLYNLFAYPKLGQQWLQAHDLPVLPLDDSAAVMISAQEDQADYLWEPIFVRLGRQDLLSEVKDYPTISQIKNLVGDHTIAVFIDEIEDWYDGMSDDRARRGRNRGFLQNLTEVASEPGVRLFAYISLLDRSPDLKKLLQRTGSVSENMVAVGEQWAIVQHRLFQQRDTEKARQIAEAYLTTYGDYTTQDLSVETMVQLYPFHPALFTTLKQIYGARTQQGIRDTLRTLAHLVVTHQDNRDLLLVSDVPPDELLAIDPELHTALREDIERCQHIGGAAPLLSTVFFYSLRPGVPGATVKELVQGLLRPDGTVNDQVIIPLKKLQGGEALHLQSNGRYQITPEMNVYALIRAEANRVERARAEAKIDELLRKEVFGGTVYLFSDLPDIDNRQLKVVVSPRDMTDEEINTALGTLNWSNRVVIVVPKAFLGMQSVYDVGDNLENAKRVVAEDHLLTGERRDIEQLRAELRMVKNEEDLPRLLDDLRGAYGRFVQWLMGSDQLSKRTAEPDLDAIKRRAVAGKDAAYDQILKELEDQDFIEVKHLMDNFFCVRRYPVVKARQDIEDALSDLYSDREIGFKGLKQYYLPGPDAFPLGVGEGLSVARYEVLKQWAPEEEEQEKRPPGDNALIDIRRPGQIDHPQGAKPGEAGPTDQLKPVGELKSFSIVGRTPLGLQEIGPQDEVTAVTILVDERQLPLNKSELQSLIRGLPEGTAVRLQLEVVQRG